MSAKLSDKRIDLTQNRKSWDQRLDATRFVVHGRHRLVHGYR